MRPRTERNQKHLLSPCHILISPMLLDHLVEDVISPHHTLAACHVALSEQALFLRAESSDDRMCYTLVVEQDKVALNPVMCVDIFGTNSRALQSVDQVPCFLQVRDHLSVWLVDGLDGGRVDLESEFASDRVLPAHRQDLNLTLIHRGQLRERELQSVRNHSQTISSALSWAHPNVRMRCVFDFRSTDKLLVLLAKNVVHVLTRDESSGAKGNIHLFSRSIIISEGLTSSSRDLDCHKGGNLWWVESIQSGVNVPSVESREVQVILLWDDRLVEDTVVRMLEHKVFQAFVFILKFLVVGYCSTRIVSGGHIGILLT